MQPTPRRLPGRRLLPLVALGVALALAGAEFDLHLASMAAVLGLFALGGVAMATIFLGGCRRGARAMGYLPAAIVVAVLAAALPALADTGSLPAASPNLGALFIALGLLLPPVAEWASANPRVAAFNQGQLLAVKIAAAAIAFLPRAFPALAPYVNEHLADGLALAVVLWGSGAFDWVRAHTMPVPAPSPAPPSQPAA